ncbi:carph-isopro domain-containing protein [Sphingomonas sp. TX0522]|uniref:carph-isopro domain-containing protein n=1 Tax=Sphingomonas sp. TX0522 TaxID=2479205 RepID=UPI003FA7520F
MDHAELIRQHGGIRPLARALGHKNHTTVQGWLERNNIPPAHLPDVERLKRPSTEAAA